MFGFFLLLTLVTAGLGLYVLGKGLVSTKNGVTARGFLKWFGIEIAICAIGLFSFFMTIASLF